jgi:hypothetical protein
MPSRQWRAAQAGWPRPRSLARKPRSRSGQFRPATRPAVSSRRMMVTGGVLQQEATKLGLGKVEATATTSSGPAPIVDALLSGSADYGAAALPSLLTLWNKTHGAPNEVKAVGTMSNGAMVLYTINPNVTTVADFTEKDRIAVLIGAHIVQCDDAGNGGGEIMERHAPPRPSDGRPWPLGRGRRAVGGLRLGNRDGAYRRAALHGPRSETTGCTRRRG